MKRTLMALVVMVCGSAASGVQYVQQAKLVGTAAVGSDVEQGYAVALSADGGTLIVGAPTDAGEAGAAWLFTRAAGVWTQQGGKLVATNAVGDAAQGASVGLSADGNTAIVGGMYDNGKIGAAWIFTRNGGVWSQQAKLVGIGAVGSDVEQGLSVALSADGSSAMLGAPYDNDGTGAAWVFARTGNAWTQQGGKLVGTGASGQSAQGTAVALSADGSTAVVGGAADAVLTGATWVFTRVGGVWRQQGAKLVGTGVLGIAAQGWSADVSADGNTIVVGGFFDNNAIGATWVFTRSGATWSQQGAKLAVNDAVGQAGQGASVALTADGNTLIVGGPFDGDGGGAAWVFTRSGGAWTQQGAKLVGTSAIGPANQGTGVAVSADAGTVVIGGPLDANLAGAAWVFDNGPAPSCTFTLSPTSLDLASTGGGGTVVVTVTSGSNCPWTATSNAGWISLTGATAGTSAGTVDYVVQPNTGNARTGTISIAGQTFTVNQSAPGCSWQLSATAADLPAEGGTGRFDVTTSSVCPWTATSGAPWLRLTGFVSGISQGTVSFAADGNPGAARSATIAVADQAFTVDQAGGAQPVFTRWIPAVIHKDVPSKNARWRSEVAVVNRSSSAGRAMIVAHSPAGRLEAGPLALPPNGQLRLADVAGQLGLASDSGSLEVTADQDFVLSGRTYNQVDETHTYGQNYDGQAAAELLGPEQSAWLPQLAQNALFRTNIGITNTGPEVAMVMLTLYDASGRYLTSDLRAYYSGEFYQYQEPFAAVGGADNGYAQIRVIGGSGVVAYASVIDQGTGDPTTIAMQASDGALGTVAHWIPAVIHKDVPSKNARWRSDVAILNVSDSPANVTLAIHVASGPVQAGPFPIAAHAQLLIADVAGTLSVAADSGALEVVSDQDVVVSGRTYNQVDATHTYGQNYDGRAPAELLDAGESAWLPQLAQNALFRTNVGLTNTGPVAANVTVTLYDAAGNAVWSDARDYRPGEFFQYQEPFSLVGGADNGYARIAVNSGSGIVAYASVIDQGTGDPTTISMRR